MQKIKRWHDAGPPGTKRHQNGSVVEQCALHVTDDSAAVLQDLQIRFSVAVAEVMSWVRDHLTVAFIDDPTGKSPHPRLATADLVLTDEERIGLPEWIEKLFRDDPTADTPDLALHRKPLHAIRIAWGVRKAARADQDERWEATHRDPRLVLQQLLLRLAAPVSINDLPPKLRAGVGQEAAQQIASHLMLADSGTVKVAVFPTMEDRDPLACRTRWEEALTLSCQRATPFPYQRVREIDPRAYAPDDSRGDRLVNTDPVWQRVMTGPCARLLPLLWVSGKDIGLYQRTWTTPQKKTARQVVVALPVSRDFLDTLEPSICTHLQWWRRLTETHCLQPLLPRTPVLTPSAPVLMIPLSFSRRRFEHHILPALQRGLPLQWARVLHRPEQGWILQLTIGYGKETPLPRSALGIHFGLDDLYWWALVAEGPDGSPVLQDFGHVSGNPILSQSLHKKGWLEWDQKRGRWIGGRVYVDTLRTATHRVLDDILRLAMEKGDGTVPAGIGIERVRWVEKSGGSRAENLRFSNWNYGELRRSGKYKAEAAEVAFTEIWPKKVTRQLSDEEQARLIAFEAWKRLRQRARRVEQASQ